MYVISPRELVFLSFHRSKCHGKLRMNEKVRWNFSQVLPWVAAFSDTTSPSSDRRAVWADLGKVGGSRVGAHSGEKNVWNCVKIWCFVGLYTVSHYFSRLSRLWHDCHLFYGGPFARHFRLREYDHCNLSFSCPTWTTSFIVSVMRLYSLSHKKDVIQLWRKIKWPTGIILQQR